MSAAAIPLNQLSAADAEGRLTGLARAVERGELKPVDAFDALVATASGFVPAKSLGVETPAYAESRAKSQALDRALASVVDRALATLPAEPASRKAALEHLRHGLEPFARRPAAGEARWSGVGLNELLYRIAKAEEAPAR